jgi:predicted molibdopterin-dependent oxidoreductase YjgC
MFEAMEHGDLHALYVLGENPMQSEADATRRARCSRASSC